MLLDHLHPVTSEIGLINIGYEDLGERGLLNSMTPDVNPVESPAAPLASVLPTLLPLRMHKSPYVYIETADPAWTAFFSGYKLGHRAIQFFASRTGRVPGWRSFANYFRTEDPASCTFQYCANNETRIVGAHSDYGKWEFRTDGPVAPFENTDAYTARRIRDRLTPTMVESYAATLGLPISDESFYCGRSTMMAVAGTTE